MYAKFNVDFKYFDYFEYKLNLTYMVGFVCDDQKF